MFMCLCASTIYRTRFIFNLINQLIYVGLRSTFARSRESSHVEIDYSKKQETIRKSS